MFWSRSVIQYRVESTEPAAAKELLPCAGGEAAITLCGRPGPGYSTLSPKANAAVALRANVAADARTARMRLTGVVLLSSFASY